MANRVSGSSIQVDAATREDIARLFKEHNQNLLHFLRRKGLSAQEAHDVAQEAYVKVLGLSDASAVNFLRSYLFTTAANLAANRFHYGNRRRELDDLVFFEEQSTGSPEQACLAQADLEVIARVIEGLPLEVQRAFKLMKFDGLKSEAAARVMGVHHRKVRRYAAQAMEQIYKALHR